jgi:predicted RNase H-like HicB family nuclease
MKVQDYMALPYSILIRHIHGSHYCASVFELDGCTCNGDTSEEAFENIQEAMENWIGDKLENGLEVPLPLEDELPEVSEPAPATDKFSGRFVVRMPKTLHARLAKEAGKEGVSLNQYVIYKLSLSVKQLMAAKPQKKPE